MANEMLFMDLTLKGKKVPGDSKIKGYEGLIELKSMSWGLAFENKTAAKGDTKAVKNLKAEELRLSKYFDGATTALFNNMDETDGLRASGAPDPSFKTNNTAVITLVGVTALQSGETMPVLMKVTLAGARLKSVSSRASESGSFLSLTEDVKLAFKDLKIDYFPAAKGNQRGGAMTFQHEGKE